ncbi:chemotaxis protein CheW [Litchfieldia alkalitelluris]|uniref:chemotaxis protein CheW n=1 Tax=Litchfieldia alkalitelluris TaxID=304268 RepID=UPI0009963307|nr:chemotaxis protein CheW [Litchfieldia alkalitelluris]
MSSTKVIVFKVGNEEYVIDIFKVQSIERMQDVTAIPNSSPALIGVTNIRGEVLPLFDLHKILTLKEVENTDNTRIILVESQGKTLGVVVDEASEVLEISHDIIQQPSFTVSEDSFIKGVATLEARMLIVLDIEKLLSNDNVSADVEKLQAFIHEGLMEESV